ncbi:alkylation response protein AidB-like acyl-CoA dehydrogenase [Crossiella equi]|uniref:Alkylation response protein AidB-like acyl-CoA dehydrogenase n=1 Tax=Crossiella equi TaxID=130796 RepID=A0ABS5AQB0_9PSEU|nr:acyl-CoA dehydrogenase family protein [Crossiella equi]MBP2477865.1 alkylation response protein AidB-like acyl-CoA dehydrogenase [Crossiella equi]
MDLRFTAADRAVCDELLPGLRERLAALTLAEREAPDGKAIQLFREHGGARLVVPSAYGGTGGSAVQAVHVQRALGALAPSLAVATMMHHFSVGSLYGMARVLGAGTDTEVLHRIPAQDLLLASGFAEGISNQDILRPTLRAESDGAGGHLLNGSKKPCSLSRSMDLLSASVAVPGPDGQTDFGLVLVPADSPGLSVHPFWSTFALAGAESHEVRLTDVPVPEGRLVRATPELAGRVLELQVLGMIWFQLSVCSVYAGLAGALVDRVLHRARGSAADRADLLVRHQAAALLTEGLARRVDAGGTGADTLADALVTRQTVQRVVVRTASLAAELLGGMAFLAGDELAYLVAAAHAVTFHPPGRTGSELVLAHLGEAA